MQEFLPITQSVCGLSSYCNPAVFQAVLQATAGSDIPSQMEVDEPSVVVENFLEYWTRELENKTPAQRLHRVLRKQNQRWLDREDFRPVVQEILDRHPGLEFLQATPEFQEGYLQTVIARIFYAVNRAGDDRLTVQDLAQSNLLAKLALLDDEEDINKINDYFSYEHFYVIYCKFWELDLDHNSLLDAEDLLRYDDFALTPRVVERVMAGYGRPLRGPNGMMSYEDFIVFLISEVDKTSATSQDYWFRVLDLDGDGVLSVTDLSYFFEQQKPRMQAMSQEIILFEDVLCQMTDMIHPARDGYFTRKDIRRCKCAAVFLDAMFNMNRFALHETRDPVRIRQLRSSPQLSDWDRYAHASYHHLADDDDDSIDERGPNSNFSVAWGNSVTEPHSASEDEDEDFSLDDYELPHSGSTA
jgi:serine/threonine-protein phosphatase 2A regulatory subunit B''